MLGRAAAAAAALAAVLALARGVETNVGGRLQEMAGGGLAYLNDGTYTALVQNRHREEHVFVLFTARDTRYQCSICGPTESELSVLASSYWRRPREENDVHFAVVDFPTGRAAFELHNFKQVPILVHFPPAHGLSPAAIADDQRFAMLDGSPSAEQLASFVRSRTRVHIEVVRSPLARIATLVGVLVVVAALGKVALDHQDLVLERIRDKSLWRSASLGVYFLAISGMVFVVIRNPPPFYCSAPGKCMFIYPQSGSQFVVEGLLIGAFNIGCLWAVVTLWSNARKRGSASSSSSSSSAAAAAAGRRAGGGSRSGAGAGSGSSDDGMNMGLVMIVVAVFAFAFLYGKVVSIYRQKSPWYPFRLLFF